VAKWYREGSYTSIGEIIVGQIDSTFAIEKDIARELESNTRKTAIILNVRGKGGSIRGLLSGWLASIFSDRSILEVGGHPGFMGFKLVGSWEEALERIRARVKELI